MHLFPTAFFCCCLCLCGDPAPAPWLQVVKLLRRSKLLGKIGEDNIHVNMHDAVELSRLGLDVTGHDNLGATLDSINGAV